MSTFITKLDASGSGPTVAVKDLVDVAGVPTTAGSQAVARDAVAAGADAPLLRGLRDRGARIVGKANLHELAFGSTGINPWSGTPVNPLGRDLLPGGSSSGSAVAVASGEADLAIGSDTGGSVRIPAAFCGVCGLKTTFGRIPVTGVFPLAPSLDTIGPLARDVSGVSELMAMLEPGFEPAPAPALRIGRLRLPTEDVDAAIDEAVDAALLVGEFEITELVVPEWGDAWRHCSALLVTEAAWSNRAILADPERAALLGDDVGSRLLSANNVSAAELRIVKQFQGTWRSRLAGLFGQVELLALPTVSVFPPLIDGAQRGNFTGLTNPVNLAGFPALSLPIPSGQALPASLQLIGPAGSDELLVATGLRLERALGGAFPA